MGFRKLNPRLVKIHRNYTIEEIALLFDIHKNTVRGWIKRDGLPICDDQRPFLVFGRDSEIFWKRKGRRINALLSLGKSIVFDAEKRKGQVAEWLIINRST